MKVLALRIRGFRGIKQADIVLDDHVALIGPNGVGKSTLVDSLALLFGRSKLVPSLTEHDFTGSKPTRADRITIIATLGGFTPDDPEAHRATWLRQGRGVEKFWSAELKKTVPDRTPANEPLCVEIGFCARFDHDELVVDQKRYFHDDDADLDPFDDGVVPLPSILLNEVGFYVLPARRTWEMAVSFASELFRKAVKVVGGIPSNAVLQVRDRLRTPESPIEEDEAIVPFVRAVNERLARLLPDEPELQIRLTATDSESVLKSLVPHYLGADGTSLPAGRHGGGMLALQTLILLLETGAARRADGKSFILALEEPELHVPPGLQRQIVSEATAIATQTICTTHSPRVAACYSTGRVHVTQRENGVLYTKRLLSEPPLLLPNAARKLLVDERLRLLEALMYQQVLVPEGRIDFEFLRLLVEVAQGPAAGAGAVRFETTVGVIPTPDARVVETLGRLRTLRTGVFAVVDGDAAGDGYVGRLAAAPGPHKVVLQWPVGFTIEDVIAWVASAAPEVVASIRDRVQVPMATTGDLAASLKSVVRPHGLKEHYLAYEEVAFALRESEACAQRAALFLNAVSSAAAGSPDPALFPRDAARSTETATVLRFVPT